MNILKGMVKVKIIKKLATEFDQRYCKAAENYMQSKIDELKDIGPGKAYQVLKNMGALPGDCTDNQVFTLSNHQDENLSDQDCTDRIAEYFASISRE